jgi:predicted nucleic acid-binding protein
MIFCDTSTVAKLYVPELQSAAARKVLEGAPEVVASELVRLELTGVFHRRLRENKWTRSDFDAALRQFSHDDVAGFWTWLALDSTIVSAATKTMETLPANLFLRSADCLHLVTAIHHGFTEVHTHDVHQIAAASALGLRTITIAP